MKYKVHTTLIKANGWAAIDDFDTQIVYYNIKNPYEEDWVISAVYLKYADDLYPMFMINGVPVPNYLRLSEEDFFQQSLVYNGKIPFELLLVMQRISNKIHEYKEKSYKRVKGSFEIEF